MSNPRRSVRRSRIRGIWIAFAALILIGMLFGLLSGARIIDKELAETVFVVSWLLAINTWVCGVIIEGEVFWRGGPLLASRELHPVKFWCFVCVVFVVFNAFGFLMLSRQVAGKDRHGRSDMPNQRMERTGGSRLALLECGHLWRLPPVAHAYRWASMRTIPFLCILLPLCAGCFLGDRMPESRAVFFTLPLSSKQSGASLSVDSPQMQEAVKFVDTELTSEGYVRDQIPEGAAGQGLVASYAQHTDTGLRLVGGPILYLSDDHLRVAFGAGGGMGSRISPETQTRIETLRDTLSHRYGSENVKIER